GRWFSTIRDFMSNLESMQDAST
ncbi:sensory box protein, partial [Vibrio parahaemolyticus V-223/04]